MRRLILTSCLLLPLVTLGCDPGDGGGDSDASTGDGTEGGSAEGDTSAEEGGSQSGDAGSTAGDTSSSAEGGDDTAGAEGSTEGEGDAGEGDAGEGEGDATAGEGEGEGGGDPQMLCEGSGGTWDDTSCGDYVCGAPPSCEAIIPGCDCGKGASYVEGEGCREDAACGDTGDVAKCVMTGGTWDPLSCGHYTCGEIPDCDAIVPGCDCGKGSSFADEAGCATDPSCE